MKIELWHQGECINKSYPVPSEAFPFPRVGEELRVQERSSFVTALFQVKAITHEWNRSVIRLYLNEIK